MIHVVPGMEIELPHIPSSANLPQEVAPTSPGTAVET